MKLEKNRQATSYKQGEFDALCGVYSLINIVHYMTKANKTQMKVLFIDALKFLKITKKKKLISIMEYGLTFKEVKSLLFHFLPQFNIEYLTPFDKGYNPSIEEYWAALEKFLNSTQRNCVFLRVTGTLNHWTVAGFASKKMMYLLDSRNLKLLRKKNCGIHKIDNSRTHHLWASQTLFITYKKK